jgi:hypothetical protein
MAYVVERWIEIAAKCDRCGRDGWVTRSRLPVAQNNPVVAFNDCVETWAADAAPGLKLAINGAWACPACKP